ncbi:MAG: hypothetical protein WAM39_07135 [Bryobacteraceae bacterium]
MGNPTEEKRIFSAFLADCPLFAGSPVTNWTQPRKDPPDIECHLEDGRTIGLELTNWLNERQIANAKGQESIEEPFRRALRMVPNGAQHFQFVWMNVKERLRRGDEAALQDEMTRLMAYLDKRWEAEPGWQSPQGFDWNDFTGYPTLARYLVNLDIHPRQTPGLTTEPAAPGWLTFPCRGGHYSPYWAVDALCENINAKTAKYSARPTRLAKFFLLVHYDFKAYAYNSPVEGIGFSYSEATVEASRRLGQATGVFDGIFVYVDTTDGQKSFKI